MNAYSAYEKIREKLDESSALFSSYGLLCKTEIECTTKKNANCQPEDAECRYISGYISVYTDEIDPDDGYDISISVMCDKGEVNSSELEDEIKFFNSEQGALSDGLLEAEDKNEFLKQYVERAKREAEVEMEKFMKDMRAKNLAVGVICALGILVIIVTAVVSALV